MGVQFRASGVLRILEGDVDEIRGADRRLKLMLQDVAAYLRGRKGAGDSVVHADPVLADSRKAPYVIGLQVGKETFWAEKGEA
jgi:hypothetical protein